MNPELIPQLIAEIGMADHRVMRTDPIERRAQVRMWAGILADIPYDFAVTAAQNHYRTSQWAILPANIAEQWRSRIRDRADRHVDPIPAADPDNPAAYLGELRDTRRDALADTTPHPPRHVLGPGAPQVAALAYDPDDVRAMRMQGDLAQMWHDIGARTRDRNDSRKAMVLKHPDLKARLTGPPLGFRDAGQWSGSVAEDDTWQGRRNDSPFAAALSALVAEARAREAS